MYLANVLFGTSIGTMMDPQFIDKPWSLAKAGLGGGAPVGAGAGYRRLRDRRDDPAAARQPARRAAEQYVVAGRAKGLPSLRLLGALPLRMR